MKSVTGIKSRHAQSDLPALFDLPDTDRHVSDK